MYNIDKGVFVDNKEKRIVLKKISSIIMAILSLFKKTNFDVLNENFDEIYETLKYFIAKQLFRIFSEEFNKQTAEALSVQVMLYLMGADLSFIYKTRDKDIQDEIDMIWDLIEPKAINIMKTNNEIKELIMRTLMIKMILFKSRYGKKWINTLEFRNAEKILKMNENTYKDLFDIENFLLIANQFIEDQKKL